MHKGSLDGVEAGRGDRAFIVVPSWDYNPIDRLDESNWCLWMFDWEDDIGVDVIMIGRDSWISWDLGGGLGWIVDIYFGELSLCLGQDYCNNCCECGYAL